VLRKSLANAINASDGMESIDPMDSSENLCSLATSSKYEKQRHELGRRRICSYLHSLHSKVILRGFVVAIIILQSVRICQARMVKKLENGKSAISPSQYGVGL